MNQFAILRRHGWKTPDDLHAAAGRSKQVGETMPGDVRWIRTYVVKEADGSLGSVCIYEAKSVDAIRDHARRADLPLNEIFPIADTVVVRPDPNGGK